MIDAGKVKTYFISIEKHGEEILQIEIANQ